MNSTASVFSGSSTGEPVAETVFDSASVKRGRGRPRKHVPEPSQVGPVENPVAEGSLSDILKNATEFHDGEVKKVFPEYSVVHDGKPDELVKKVNGLLLLGWKLAGGLVITPNGLFVQSLYKET